MVPDISIILHKYVIVNTYFRGGEVYAQAFTNSFWSGR